MEWKHMALDGLLGPPVELIGTQQVQCKPFAFYGKPFLRDRPATKSEEKTYYHLQRTFAQIPKV
jgi:hypothetical protein